MADGTPTWDETEEITPTASTPSWDDTTPVESTPDAPRSIGQIAHDAVDSVSSFSPLAAGTAIGTANLRYLKDSITGEAPGKGYGEYLKEGYQTGRDMHQGALQGFTLGGVDELAGAAGAAGAKLTGDDRPISDIYREAQQGAQSVSDEAKLNSPIAHTAGELVGGVALGAAVPNFGVASNVNKALGVQSKAAILEKLGVESVAEALKLGKGKELLQLLGPNVLKGMVGAGAEGAALGAAQGGLSSKGEFGSEQLKDDVNRGGTFGLIAGSGMHAAGEIAPVAAEAGLQKMDQSLEGLANSDSSRTRKMYEAYKRTRSGKPKLDSNSAISSEAITNENADNTTEFTNRFLNAENEIGSTLAQEVQNATDAGVKLSINPALEKTTTELELLAKRRPELVDDPEFGKLIKKLYDFKSTEVTPSDAWALKDQFKDFAYKLKDPQLDGVAKIFNKGLNETLESNVPNFKELNGQFKAFRENGRETLMGRGTNPEFNDSWISDVKNGKARTENDVRAMFEGLSAPGSGPVQEKARRQAKYLVENIEKLEAAYPGSVKQLGYESVDALKADLTKKADLISLNRAINGARLNTDEVGLSANPVKMAGAMYKASFGEPTQYSLAQKAGQFARKLETKLRGVPAYNAAGPEVSAYADELINSGNASKAMHGKALRDALQSNDLNKKNATLFVLQQLHGRSEKDDE